MKGESENSYWFEQTTGGLKSQIAACGLSKFFLLRLWNWLMSSGHVLKHLYEYTTENESTYVWNAEKR